jgi:epoxyqueuosine reductase
VLVDSAPVLEVALATKSGIGWRGKHTLSLNRDAGSMYFLGEIFVDIPLPIDPPISNHCGTCQDCIDICPTQAIIAPFQIDANRCISYLTIEHPGTIPTELRPLMGNHVYGCDDCQLVCHWNKFAKSSNLADFDVRNQLDSSSLEQLFAWDQEEFEKKMQGSAIYRIGYERWMRNIAVALGNYLRSEAMDECQKAKVVELLTKRIGQISSLVDEHINWALDLENSIK